MTTQTPTQQLINKLRDQARNADLTLAYLRSMGSDYAAAERAANRLHERLAIAVIATLL